MKVNVSFNLTLNKKTSHKAIREFVQYMVDECVSDEMEIKKVTSIEVNTIEK